MKNNKCSQEEVLQEELRTIEERRKACKSKNLKVGFNNKSDLFGIALSGGGIRSATINLGILKILNKCGILPMADYLSTVSGGGYIGSYCHAKLRQNTSQKDSNALQENPFSRLFEEEDIEHLKKYGYYLTPGKGLKKNLAQFRFIGAYVFSILMNCIWLVSLFFTAFFFFQAFCRLHCLKDFWQIIGRLLPLVAALILVAHFFFHWLSRFKIWSSDKLNFCEGIIVLGFVLYGPYLVTASYPSLQSLKYFFIAGAIFVLTGFFANPNVITMHRFYRDRLATAYLHFAKDITLPQLSREHAQGKSNCAPYPLINACLNLLEKDNKTFKGTKTCDYFLLSPLYCGAKLSGYIGTNSPGYKNMTLATAIAASGAAISANMGLKANKILAFLLTIFNIRLGYWAVNPKYANNNLKSWITWWPYYNIIELLSRTNAKRWRVNITDGGHIENLGIFELLRRKCRLIIAIDASADPDYSFSDLANLVIRARNMLGIAITFRQSPEKAIKPSPSKGFSESHFVIADIENLPKEGQEKEGFKREDKYRGLLVYIKSSLRAQEKFKEVKTRDENFFYKVSHPSFPHESTVDQFFDEDQWLAYYNLGQYMAGDLLKIDVRKNPDITPDVYPIKTADELYEKFDKIKDEGSLKYYLNL